MKTQLNINWLAKPRTRRRKPPKKRRVGMSWRCHPRNQRRTRRRPMATSSLSKRTSRIKMKKKRKRKRRKSQKINPKKNLSPPKKTSRSKPQSNDVLYFKYKFILFNLSKIDTKSIFSLAHMKWLSIIIQWLIISYYNPTLFSTYFPHSVRMLYFMRIFTYGMKSHYLVTTNIKRNISLIVFLHFKNYISCQHLFLLSCFFKRNFPHIHHK